MFMLQRVLDKVLTKWLQLCSYFIHSQMPKLVMLLLPTNSILLTLLYSDSNIVIHRDVRVGQIKARAHTRCQKSIKIGLEAQLRLDVI